MSNNNMNSERFEILILDNKEFVKILPKICDAKITKYPALWNSKNPLFGTCVPVSLVAQKLFGGKLLRANLKPFPEHAKNYSHWHWANLLPNGEVVDFTAGQFEGNYPWGLEFVVRPTSSITRYPDVVGRSNLLLRRLLGFIQSHQEALSLEI